MTSGTSSIPPSAARAPRQPKKRSPSISARLTTFGPGSTWLSDEHLDELLPRQPALALDQLVLGDRQHAAEALQGQAVEGEEQLGRATPAAPARASAGVGAGDAHAAARPAARVAQRLTAMQAISQARPTQLSAA